MPFFFVASSTSVSSASRRLRHFAESCRFDKEGRRAAAQLEQHEGDAARRRRRKEYWTFPGCDERAPVMLVRSHGALSSLC